MQEIDTIIKPYAVRRFIKKRTILFYQGEIPRLAYYMKKGTIKVYSIDNSGEEQIVSFHTPGDLLPLSWIFNKSSSTLFYYEAMNECEVLCIPKEELLNLLHSNPHLSAEILDYFINNYNGLLLRVRALEQSRAIEKVLLTLYYLTFRYGKEISKDIFTIELELTHATIASLVGLTRETTTTTLNTLRRKKIVSYKKSTYAVNKLNLERYIGEDTFRDFVMA